MRTADFLAWFGRKMLKQLYILKCLPDGYRSEGKEGFSSVCKYVCKYFNV